MGDDAGAVFIGVSTCDTLGHWSLQYTQALNALLLQSSSPLYVALFSLLLFVIRLTWPRRLASLTGVLIILLRGDLATLFSIQLNKGDIGYTIAQSSRNATEQFRIAACPAKKTGHNKLSFMQQLL